ncbi:GNAT family N-acetyltransferase [Pseudomonas koreensis]|uniref:GNAT family N-acetyltransferase n=1 Tax=Pseudomonas koreensis TaxID=198620 RepID=A0A9X2XHC8_9PSED|nr:GNAT family N-acetyltransferase [Pseudomonas koreensis]MCU7248588.1 GNAT family N-acetyltransferase [Pseudomonas koreensis]
MEAPIYICPATAADASIIQRIVERSIRIGCVLDHRNDARLVIPWLAQQACDHIHAWLADPRRYLNIALLHDKPIGAGMAAANGDITFCHVQPEWCRRGAGRALMADLEGWLRIRGTAGVHLNSTRSGAAFYQRLGYRESAQPLTQRGMQTFPMHKPLAASA